MKQKAVYFYKNRYSNGLVPKELRGWAEALDKQASDYEPLPDEADWRQDDSLEWLDIGSPIEDAVRARESLDTANDYKRDQDHFCRSGWDGKGR